MKVWNIDAINVFGVAMLWSRSCGSVLPPAYGPLRDESEMVGVGVGVIWVTGQQGMQINACCNLWVECCSFRITDLHENVLYRSWVWTNSDTCLWCGSASANCSIKVLELRSGSTFQCCFVWNAYIDKDHQWCNVNHRAFNTSSRNISHVHIHIRIHF